MFRIYMYELMGEGWTDNAEDRLISTQANLCVYIKYTRMRACVCVCVCYV
jgi:hypothetical protein